MEENLDEIKAMEFAERLTTIPESPRSDIALHSIAEHLTEICKDEGEARLLTKQAERTWERWLGVKGLIDLLEQMRHPVSSAPERQVLDLGPKPEVQCSYCNDFGHRTIAGRYQFCACNAGILAKEEHGQSFLDVLNRKKPIELPPTPKRAPITQDDFDKLKEKPN